MTKQRKPATFQPTIRPSWSGAMSYIQVEEKAKILEALIKYPEDTGIESIFWKETIKPDLDLQYEKFLSTCQARKQVARTYWDNQKVSKGMQMDTKSISNDIQKVSNTKDKDKDKDKDNNGDNINQNNEDNQKINKKEYPEDFETFWSIYPSQRKGCKKKAYNAYCRAIKEKRCTKEKLLESVKKYSVSKTVKDGYAKGCEAWLNDDRFNWHYEEPISKAPIGMFGKPIEGYHEW